MQNNSSKTPTDKIDEFILPLEDIAEVVSSSYDGRFPPKGLFHHSSSQSPNRFINPRYCYLVQYL